MINPFCVTPLTIGIGKVVTDLIKQPSFVGYVLGLNGFSVKDYLDPTAETRTGDNDVQKRGFMMTIPPIYCDSDPEEAIDWCAGDRPTAKSIKTTTRIFLNNPEDPISRSNRVGRETFRNLMLCDFQKNDWTYSVQNQINSMIKELDLKMMTKLNSMVGAYNDGTFAPIKSLVLLNAQGLVGTGMNSLILGFNSRNWNVSPKDLIVLSPQMGLTNSLFRNTVAPNNSTGLDLTPLQGMVNFVDNSDITAVTGNPNHFIVFHKDAFRLFFYSQNEIINNSLKNGAVSVNNTTMANSAEFAESIKGLFGNVGKLADKIENGQRIDTTIMIPIASNDGTATTRFIPVDFTAIYRVDCTEWDYQFQIRYHYIPQLIRTCNGESEFNGVTKWQGCELENVTCPTPSTPVTPPVKPTKCLTYEGCLPITITKITVVTDGGFNNVIELPTPITITTAAELINVYPALAGFATWNTETSQLCFVGIKSVQFNAEPAILL